MSGSGLPSGCDSSESLFEPFEGVSNSIGEIMSGSGLPSGSDSFESIIEFSEGVDKSIVTGDVDSSDEADS